MKIKTFLGGKSKSLSPAICYVILSCLLWLVPLFNLLHAESSAVIAGVSFFIAGLAAIGAFRRGETFGETLAWQLSLLIIPWFLLTFSLLWQDNCSYGQGFLLFLLFTLPAAVLGVSLAYLIAGGRIRWKKTLLILAGIFMLIAGPIFDLGFHSQFFTYNHLFGGVLGPIYDEELTIRKGLIFFRLRTLLIALFCWLWAESAKSVVTSSKRWLMWGTAFLVILSYVFSAQLRINTPAWYIKQQLNGHVATEHFDIYYDDVLLDSAIVTHYVYEHEFRYQDIKAKLGIDVSERIQTFIYGDAETKHQLTGSRYTSVAPVWLPNPQMHILAELFDRVFPHELAHVFSREFGLPLINASLSVGLVEGLAVSLEPADGRPTPHEQVLTAITNATKPNEPIKIAERIGLAQRLTPLGFWTGRGAVSYTTMGSFVRYLADTYGYEKVSAVYARGNYEAVFDKPIDVLVTEWEDHLLALPYVDRATHAHVTRSFAIPSLFEKRCPHYLPRFERAYREGMVQLLAGDTTQALVQLSESIRRAPEYDVAIDAWGGVKIPRGEVDTVITKIESTFLGADASPSGAGVWMRYGDALAVKGMTTEALAAFDSALVRLPLYAYQQRGAMALRIALADNMVVQRINRTDRSRMRKVRELEVLATDDPNILVLQGVILGLDFQFDEALAYFSRYRNAIAGAGHDAAILLLVRELQFQLHYATGDYEAAYHEATALQTYFESVGAFNSAEQYTDFASKMLYIMD